MTRLDCIAAQLSPANLLHEGAGHVCDVLQDTMGADTLIPVTHTYWYCEPPELACDNLGCEWVDHGVPLPDPVPTHPKQMAWVPYRERHYAATRLRHQRAGDVSVDDGPDVLAELVPEAKRRGMKVIPRILEGMAPATLRRMPGWTQVCTVDREGRRGHLPCWRHPEWRAFWLATIEDMFVHYELDGLLLGAERGGPLGPMLAGGDDQFCFCSHCQAAARDRGIDVARARAGVAQLQAVTASAAAGTPQREGTLVGVLRAFLDYPEILAWHRLDVTGKQSLEADIYGSVHNLLPSAKVGWFIPTYGLAWDWINRADLDYATMAPFSDFYRPALYESAMGKRFHNWLESSGGTCLWGELQRETTVSMLYAMMGLDEQRMPKSADLPTSGFGEEWVRREVRRCIDESSGTVACWPALGIGTGGPKNDGNPHELGTMIRAALEEGATGLVIGRYYKEMTMDFLRAAGAGLREAGVELSDGKGISATV